MGNVIIQALEKDKLVFAHCHQDPDKMIKAAVGYHEMYGYDCIVVPFDMALEAQCFGAEINWYNEMTDGIYYPTIKHRPVKTLEDIKVRYPKDIPKMGRMPMMTEVISRLKKMYPDVAIGTYVLGPFTILGQLRELDELFEASFLEPEEVGEQIDLITTFAIDFVKVLKAAGADYITIREMGATSDILSPNAFNSLVKPHLKRLCENVESPRILHICGDTNMIMEGMLECGADAISVDQKNFMDKSRAALGKDVVLLGNFDPFGVLCKGSPEVVTKTIKQCLANGVNAVWPGCDLWPDVPEENLKILVRESRV
jgi:[methyl-Co(III) methanol-specific corrinoid protein]:coenzyme M methyltransferase